jgi:hypothetical protein
VRTIPVERFQSTLNVLDRVTVINFAATINRDVELATSINRGLRLLRAAGRGERLFGDAELAFDRGRRRVDRQVASFVAVADQIAGRLRRGARYKPITIHRYHPVEDLGGVLGILNFARDRASWLIERGYQDALEHDCELKGCTLPEGVRRADLRPEPDDEEDDAADEPGGDDY